MTETIEGIGDVPVRVDGMATPPGFNTRSGKRREVHDSGLKELCE